MTRVAYEKYVSNGFTYGEASKRQTNLHQTISYSLIILLPSSRLKNIYNLP